MKKVPCPFHRGCHAPCPIEAALLREIPTWHIGSRAKQHAAGKLGSATTNKLKLPRILPSK